MTEYPMWCLYLERIRSGVRFHPAAPPNPRPGLPSPREERFRTLSRGVRTPAVVQNVLSRFSFLLFSHF